MPERLLRLIILSCVALIAIAPVPARATSPQAEVPSDRFVDLVGQLLLVLDSEHVAPPTVG